MLAAAPPPARPFSSPPLSSLKSRRSFYAAAAVLLPAEKLPGLVRASPPGREAASHENRTEADEDLAAGLKTSDRMRKQASRPPPPPLPLPTSADPSTKKEAGERDRASAGPLRGAVVLQALQRAVTKREEKKRKKKGGGKNWRPPTSSGRELPLGVDYGDVRPIEIQSDWARRIDELEERVRELQARCN